MSATFPNTRQILRGNPMRMLRVIYKTPFFILLAILAYAVLVYCDFRKFDRARKTRSIDWLYGSCMKLLGISCTFKGKLVPGPSLVVANHCSYLDVLLLSTMGEVFFTPKVEVRTWPLIGPLVSRFNVLYVDRKPGRTKEIQQSLMDLIRSGGRICVFPEATTNDGRTMLPFKSSLFSLAEQWKEGSTALPVQPVTVSYKRVNAEPMSDANWPRVAWYGDIDILRHLLGLFTLRSIEAELTIHPPIALLPGESRKELCARAEAIVKAGFAAGKEAA